MPVIEFQLTVDAPIERVFDLSRSVRAHLHSASRTGETLVEGPVGLMGPNDHVTWEATHLGIRQRLTAGVTIF